MPTAKPRGGTIFDSDFGADATVGSDPATAGSGAPGATTGTNEDGRRWGPTRRLALGLVAGARSGDKGGNANVGLWVGTDEAFGWLAAELSIDRLRQLLPEAAELVIDRYELPNLRAVNFVVRGLLGEGVASSTRQDAQAKSLGEYIRSRLVDVPVAIIEGGRPPE